MKSLRDEIRLRRVERTDLISPKPQGFDFIQTLFGFHRERERTISLKKGKYMTENKLVDLSMDFAVEILKKCDIIKGHYSIVNQLERSATSIGANIREANYAHSKSDFIAKLQISLKECFETEYWLELMKRSEILNDVDEFVHTCGTIRRMLISSINTAKKNNA